ncbi:MAG TPA: ATP-binding cassette domain-containing protein [Candidatus Krumholzibacteria bacterium]|nr:ATP-binding cassette domain-containing protein [Candidatus Krumholzibacteria bacterium]
MASAVVAIVALGAGVGTRILMPSPAEARRSHLRNQEIGFVFQQHHLLGDFTALENVLMPARVLGLPEREAHERARNLLVRVGLEARLDHLPGEMSGGEQQRVAVARAMINRPRLLLLDEPGGNLDRQRADDLHELLLRLAREDGIAVVAVTHDESLARRADRWLRLREGRLVDARDGSVTEDTVAGPDGPAGEEDV